MDAAGSSSTKLSQSSSKRLRDGSGLEQLALGALLTCSGSAGMGMGSHRVANESHIANEQHPRAATSQDAGMNRA